MFFFPLFPKKTLKYYQNPKHKREQKDFKKEKKSRRVKRNSRANDGATTTTAIPLAPTPAAADNLSRVALRRRAEKTRGYNLHLCRFVDVFDEHFCQEKNESNRVAARWKNGDSVTVGEDRSALQGHEIAEIHVAVERARVWFAGRVARDGAVDGCEDWGEAHASVHAGVLGRVG